VNTYTRDTVEEYSHIMDCKYHIAHR